MATTFNVIYLGVQTNIDWFEGDYTAEYAQDLSGLTFGDASSPLYEQVHSFSPAGSGYTGGNANTYDGDNSVSNDQFSIDGGAPQTYDNLTVYGATLTYADGTTADISAVIFQDIYGHTYLAPEISDNTDNVKMTAKPIESLRLNAVWDANDGQLYFDRQPGNFMVCFGRGTLISTPCGQRPIEALVAGDLVNTADHGPQPVRWIGVRRQLFPISNATLVVIEPDALGPSLPSRALSVTRQHRLLVRSRVARRMFGKDEVLVPAHRLLACPGIREVNCPISIEYWHILFDRHEIIFANEAPAESLLLGDQACRLLGKESLSEIRAIDPALVESNATPARHIPTNAAQRTLLRRIAQNGREICEQKPEDSAEIILDLKALFRERFHEPDDCVKNPSSGCSGAFMNSITSKWCRPGSRINSQSQVRESRRA